MSTPVLLTPDKTKAGLNRLSLSVLSALAEARGLIVGNTSEDGRTARADLIAVLSAHMNAFPSHVRVKSENPYHNGLIPDRAGVEWRAGEERVISLGAYQQILADVPPEHFVIIEKLNVIDVREEVDGDEG